MTLIPVEVVFLPDWRLFELWYKLRVEWWKEWKPKWTQQMLRRSLHHEHDAKLGYRCLKRKKKRYDNLILGQIVICIWEQPFQWCLWLSLRTQIPYSVTVISAMQQKERHLCNKRIAFTGRWAKLCMECYNTGKATSHNHVVQVFQHYVMGFCNVFDYI